MSGAVERLSYGKLLVGGLVVGGSDIGNFAAKAAGLNTTAYPVVTEVVLFTETTGAGTYTGTIAMPAGSVIVDVQVHGLVLWTASTSASLVVGDGSSANGFYTATNLKATDLLAGEANTIEHPGGLAGAYIASEQRVLYSAAARSVIGVVTTVGASGNAGRTLLVVHYTCPVLGMAVKS